MTSRSLRDSGELDFFRKLGYSAQEVTAALRKLGLGTDTNAVLGELVRSGARPLPSGATPSPAAGAGPAPEEEESGEGAEQLKPIVIDGSNVAMSHGNKEVFSCRGIQLAVDYFLQRGHRSITVFVPSWRKEQPRADLPIRDQPILEELERNKFLVLTPSRRVGGKRVVCYDDRFIVKLAHELDGIIVSNDTYRDLQSERPEWKRCIEESLLMYSFVNDKFMPPDDPLGRHGPTLDSFLSRRAAVLPDHKRQLCPYGKKCTYGIKCKFYHPERTNQSQRSLADELRENARLSGSRESRRSAGSPRAVCQSADPCSGFYSSPLDQDLEQTFQLQGERTAGSSSRDLHFSQNLSSFFSSDSGLGSYENLSLEELHRLRLSASSNPNTPPCAQGYPANSPFSLRQPSFTYHSSSPLNPVHSYSLPAFVGHHQAACSSPFPSPQGVSLPGTFSSGVTDAYRLTQADQRQDVRMKLHAIFNPYQVDRVMDMFPQLKDPQELAAKILRLKSSGVAF